MEEIALVSVSPKDVLSFQLKKNISPKVVFKVSNISSHKVVFKVKTTQPTWYYVRPNQMLLAPGESEDISVALVDSECNRVLQEYIQTSKQENLDKHRFLVLSKVVEEASYNAIASIDGITAQQRQEELSKLWHVTESEAATEQKGKNIKMRVELVYPDSSASSSLGDSNRLFGKGQNEPIRSTSENVDLIRKSLASNISSGGVSSTQHGTPSSPSAAGIYDANDLQILKSKYDTIVEYTVHLTAERDMIAAQLDVLKREYGHMNEQNKRKDKDVKGSPRRGADKSGKDGEGDEPSVQKQKGFSLMFLLLVAFVALLLGRYS